MAAAKRSLKDLLEPAVLPVLVVTCRIKWARSAHASFSVGILAFHAKSMDGSGFLEVAGAGREQSRFIEGDNF